jgi:Pyruvate/2-oxoacid:ferredoxin oxidoreductase delta subunit
MATVIEKGNIANLLDVLSINYRIVAPLERNGEVSFTDRKDHESWAWNYRVTVLPPKQYFFPPEELLFTYAGKRITTPAISRKKLLIFGLNLRDLEAITQLDEIMSTPQPDHYYGRRRSGSILVGVTEEPVNAPSSGDLILEKMDAERYRAIPLTEAGRKIVELNVFKKQAAFPRKAKVNPVMKELTRLLLDPETLAKAVTWSWTEGRPVWEELGKRCLGCGICTYVCPICHCFTMENTVSLDGSLCSRRRHWDACTLPGFARLAGGGDHHPSQEMRYHNWYYHKFVRAYREYGKSQCVACGRCQAYCPAGIDMEKELLQIVKAYGEAKR